METLIKTLKKNIAKLNNKHDLSDDFLDKLYSVFPFNKFEYVISHLIAEKIITLEQYLEIRNEYCSRNKFLHLFNMTTNFGEWSQNHLNELVQELQKPSKLLDKEYDGEYDFWYDNIKIEVKSSRAVEYKNNKPMQEKALGTNSKLRFDMNFQQIKPKCADVFVFIAVWRDKIKYWVLPSSDINNNKYYSPGQHRGNIDEGQLHFNEKNIKEFDNYLVSPRNLLEEIKKKGEVKL